MVLSIEEHNARKYTGKAAKAKVEAAEVENTEAEEQAEADLTKSAYIANIKGTIYDLQMLPYPRVKLLMQYREKIYRPGLNKILKIGAFYDSKDPALAYVPEDLLEDAPLQVDLFYGLVEVLLRDNHPEWPQIMNELNHGDIQKTAVKILDALTDTKEKVVSFLSPKK